MMNLDDLSKAGVIVKKYCGLDREENVGCTEEAVGDITVQLEDGVMIPIPICQVHLDMIQSDHDIEHLSA